MGFGLGSVENNPFFLAAIMSIDTRSVILVGCCDNFMRGAPVVPLECLNKYQ